MSKNNNITSVLTITILIAVTITMVSAITFSNHIVFAQKEKFNAKLSGQEEVPPVQTTASGMAWFKPMQDKVWFKVNVTDMQGVTQAHIHTGKVGENGPVVVTLYKSDTPQPINGKLAYGNITANLLEGPMKGKQLSDLATAMSNGSTYVNVHTEKHPNGEIRGQIMMANSTSDKMMMMDK
ncbi:MAG: CHRD domain-containing protein [Nitrososphaeraceae archaeon]|nr:CHRD domain-containing protein [Nitrososphaeraceae archaeon]